LEFADIADAFEPVYFSANSVVIKQGDESDEYFYIVQDGILEHSIIRAGNKRILDPFQQGSSFGEIALMYDTPRVMTVTACEDCKLWKIDRTTFRSIHQYHARKTCNSNTSLLKNISIGGTKLEEVWTSDQFDDMHSVLDTDFFSKGEVILQEGMTGDILYIIESGTVDIFKKSNGKYPISTLHCSDYFGETALLSEEVRTATCVASSDVKCLFLVRHDFVRLFGSMQDVIDGKMFQSNLLNQSERKSKVFKLALSDLEVKGTIGKGAFGRVKVVKMNSKYYALKCIPKSTVVEKKYQKYIVNEKIILASLDHPFISQFYGAIQDEKYIYFLLEFLGGGDLYVLLKKKKTFEEKEVQFYSGCVISALSYMHAKRIAYRDLKLENLVLDAFGYVKIIDFGFAKTIKGKTWTMCGSPDYIAPEIIGNDGHDWAVDYWSLGILMFEMKIGRTPFKGKTQMQMFESIMIGRIAMPIFRNEYLAHIIKKLLKANPSKRLGKTIGGAGAIRKHNYFKHFNWDALIKYELEAPYTYLVQDPGEETNFGFFSENDDEVVPCPQWNPEL